MHRDNAIDSRDVMKSRKGETKMSYLKCRIYKNPVKCSICKEYKDPSELHEVIIVPTKGKTPFYESLWVCRDCIQPLYEGVNEAIASTIEVGK